MKQTISLIIVLLIWNNLSAESISGKIIDSKTKSNIANVRVIIKDYSSTLTDDAGKFTLKIPDNIDKNKIIINFDMPGYACLDVGLNNLNRSNSTIL
ncbi:MAG: carboxypeptidase-like regulatory domain-containing protein, partial [Bacteroidales bacterium]|nr:carboxypeptidase-like regulatory domain-containing protein [Bacteroidales bacterium]